MTTTLHFAVIGNPVAHSRSPRIHGLFGQQTGIALQYDLLLAQPDEFEATARAFADRGGLGVNVTVPFKQKAFEFAREHLSERARLAGAVNTLSWKDNTWHGCNTDGVGLVGDLVRLGVQLAGARVLLVGAGGAARGVLQPLAAAGCERIHIVNRTPERADELVRGWQAAQTGLPTEISAGGLAQAALAGGWNVVVNATASSLQGAVPDLPSGLYADGALAYDMLYSAQPTPFMIQASKDGAAQCSDGLGMLVGQAAESFFIWNGVRPDPAPVLETLRAEMQARH